ncbi:MAG: gamma-glutamyltransferase [Pseudomonadota bacterium]
MTGHAIACGHPVTAEAADQILRAGGTAVDAAVGASLAATVAEPVLAGLFGGGFLLVHPAGRRAEVLDFFVHTPSVKRPEGEVDHRAIEVDFESTTQTFHVGTGTLAVPGVAPGLAEAHARFGRMPLRDLAAPAIAAARDGVEITDFQARLGRIVQAVLTDTQAVRALYCEDEDGTAVPRSAGTMQRNPDLAEVLEVFAAEGPRLMTEGEVAALLVEMAREGGHLTSADLAAYRPEWRAPLITHRAGVEIVANPPPALGGALTLFALDLLGPSPGSLDMALAFEATLSARAESGIDADPIAGSARLALTETVAHYRAMVARKAAALKGTTQISIMDRDGMGASVTLSNGTGAGLVVPGTGILPNNMLGEEDLLPAGGWTPNRRLSSMMSPVSVAWPDGGRAMLGSGGSNRIRTALAQVLVRMIDDAARLEKAIEAPRLHVDAGDPVAVDFEDLMGEAAHVALLDAFPQARAWPDLSMFFGGVHAVRRDANGSRDAVGDPRRAGVALLS